jgi:hypothetical protein
VRNVFRFAIVLFVFVSGVSYGSLAAGHGTPIHVEVVGNALSVSGGLVDNGGYAPMIFVEDDEDGDPFGEATLPGFGPSIIWQVPGYEIFGMDEHSGLFLDVPTRPFAYLQPVANHSLWYWNLQTQRAEPAPAANPLQIRKSTSVNVTLSPTDGSDPPPLQIAEPLNGDMGFHNHLVAYALNESSEPPAGAYGFFARLNSNQYAPSNPFLVVLNNGVFDYAQMVPAAYAINRSAFLPGDYNHDDRVDGADYLIWRKTQNSTTMLSADGSNNGVIDAADFGVWRSNFSASYSSSGLTSPALAEPQNYLLAVLLVLSWLRTRRFRSRKAF